MELPFVACLCPTFHRPKLLANALACFLAQDYPADRRGLMILDDGLDFASTDNRTHPGGWEIISSDFRFPTLPEKFNAAANLARGCWPKTEIFVVWEDDDIYLPHHISAHVNAMLTTGAHYSKPSTVLSTYPGHVVAENATGRFHASLAFSTTAFNRVGGWPATRRADFDQQLIYNLTRSESPVIVDPCLSAPPSYCFRYGSTQAYHGQHFMQSPDDEGWYDRVPRQPGNRDLILAPEFDDETKAVYASHSLPAKASV